MDANDIKPEKRKSRLPLILVCALLLGGGGFGAFKFLGGSNTSAAAPDAVDEHGKPIPNAEGKEGKTVVAGSKGKKRVIIREPAVVNLRLTNANRYLKIRMGFEITNDAVVDELREADSQIGDFINEKLSSYDIPQLDSTAGRNKMKRELLTGINEILKKGVVEKIYFTEFVIQ